MIPAWDAAETNAVNLLCPDFLYALGSKWRSAPPKELLLNAPPSLRRTSTNSWKAGGTVGLRPDIGAGPVCFEELAIFVGENLGGMTGLAACFFWVVVGGVTDLPAGTGVTTMGIEGSSKIAEAFTCGAVGVWVAVASIEEPTSAVAAISVCGGFGGKFFVGSFTSIIISSFCRDC